MITQTLANILPPSTTNDGLATMQSTSSTIAPVAVEENSICVCKCDYRELVFSEAGAITDWNKNDKSTLLFKKAIAGDTITIKLYKDTTPYTITDNTYGEYYPGTLPGQPLYWEFVADWNLIYNALGPGNYYFETTTIIIGATTVTESIDYYLQPYSDLAADGTIRIETYNTGTILSSDFNYLEIHVNGFYQSYRIKGKLLPKMPKLITDTYTDQDNNIIQIQDKITNEYELVLKLIPASVADVIIYDNLFANRILISDYNIFNEDVKRQIEVRPLDIEKNTFAFNKDVQFNIKFTAAKDNMIKNNF